MLALCLALAACGGSNPPSEAPLPPQLIDSFARQKPNWHACPADVTGPVMPYVGQDKRLQCAEIQVPLDYQHAEAGIATMAILRVAATDTARRRGVLVFNPGGPGGDGLILPALFSRVLDNASIQTSAGVAFRRVSAEYDLIGFSPRGVGGSTQLICSSNRVLTDVPNPNIGRSDAMVASLVENARLVAETCQSNRTSAYFNTESTARDLELLRRVLGEEKLNYYGYSYGTWLGKWFESLYPGSVGRMVLDSTMDFTGSFDDNWANQALGRQRLIDEVLAVHLASRDTVFGLGTSADAVRQEMRRWNPLVQSLAFGQLFDRPRPSFDQAMALLGAARGVDLVVAGLPAPVRSADIVVGLARHAFAGSVEQRQAMHDAANRMALAYDKLVEGNEEPLQLSNFRSLNVAVACNDTDSSADPGFWIAHGNELARRFPSIGGWLTSNPCMFWGGARVQKPKGDSRAQLLLLQSEWDPLTIREGALATFATLPNASMIVVQNEYAHGVFPYNDSCVDTPVADYLLGKAPAARRIECQGRRLPARADAAARSLAPEDARTSQPVFGNDAVSRAALEAIRDTVAGQALTFRER